MEYSRAADVAVLASEDGGFGVAVEAYGVALMSAAKKVVAIECELLLKNR